MSTYSGGLRIGDRVEHHDADRYRDRVEGLLVHALGAGYVVVIWGPGLASTEELMSLRPATSRQAVRRASDTKVSGGGRR